jgi:hypothetical protein
MTLLELIPIVLAIFLAVFLCLMLFHEFGVLGLVVGVLFGFVIVVLGILAGIFLATRWWPRKEK